MPLLIAEIYLFFCGGTHEPAQMCNCGCVVTSCLCQSFMALEVKEKGSAECLQVLMSKVVEKREGMNYNR